MNYEKWLKEYGGDLTGKRVAVTGATGSIGRELCRFLGGLGAELILACRNPVRAEEFRKSLVEEGIHADVLVLDISSRSSIDGFCQSVAERYGRLDVLFHNAGIYHLPRTENADGLEIHFATNFWGPCYLTRRILPLMRDGKVVLMSSIAFRFYKLDLEDLQSRGCKSSTKVYGRAKRLLMLGAAQLQEEAAAYGVKVALAHPGISPTEMLSSKKGFSRAFQALIVPLMKLIFLSPKKASLAGVLAVCGDAPEGSWAGPRNFGIWGKPAFRPVRRNFTEAELRFPVETLYRAGQTRSWEAKVTESFSEKHMKS